MNRRGVARAVVLLILLLLVAGVGVWLFWDDLGRLMGAGVPPAAEVSPELAAKAEAKLQRLRTQGDTVRLSTIEVASLARYRYAGWIPGDLQNPSLAMAGDTLLVAGAVPTDRLPELPDLERVRIFLPDTAQVEIAGHLRPIQPGRAAYEVTQISVARVPVPARLYPDLLRRIGQGDQAGLPPNAIMFGLPEGVGSAWVEGGFLVLAP